MRAYLRLTLETQGKSDERTKPPTLEIKHMAAIALPSFLNQANRARASTASVGNREVDSLTGMSETCVGTAAFTLEQPHSYVESKNYLGSLNRGQQAFFLEYSATADSLTDMIRPLTGMAASTLNQSHSSVEFSLTSRGNCQGAFIPILVPIFLGSTVPFSQTVGGDGVVSGAVA